MPKFKVTEIFIENDGSHTNMDGFIKKFLKSSSEGVGIKEKFEKSRKLILFIVTSSQENFTHFGICLINLIANISSLQNYIKNRSFEEISIIRASLSDFNKFLWDCVSLYTCIEEQKNKFINLITEVNFQICFIDKLRYMNSEIQSKDLQKLRKIIKINMENFWNFLMVNFKPIKHVNELKVGELRKRKISKYV
jgi:hypothetical protein